MKKRFLFVMAFFSLIQSSVFAIELKWPEKTHYRYQKVNGYNIFYREAGNKNNPTILLLHGYPSSSHTYRELIPLLSGRYHIIAPDYLGSGFSDKPDPTNNPYTFDLLAKQVSGLLSQLKIKKYSLYMQDFGAPVGYRVILNNPSALESLIVQNANAYLEGLTPARQLFFKKAAAEKKTNTEQLLRLTNENGIKNLQYLRDVKGKESIMSPDAWTYDLHFLETKKERLIQVQLFQDYQSNIDSYPKWQQFLRQNKPKTLILWGKKDPAFIAKGAEAYLKDVPDANLFLLDAGHFAVEEKPVEIAKHIIAFLSGHPFQNKNIL